MTFIASFFLTIGVILFAPFFAVYTTWRIADDINGFPQTILLCLSITTSLIAIAIYSVGYYYAYAYIYDKRKPANRIQVRAKVGYNPPTKITMHRSVGIISVPFQTKVQEEYYAVFRLPSTRRRQFVRITEKQYKKGLIKGINLSVKYRYGFSTHIDDYEVI